MSYAPPPAPSTTGVTAMPLPPEQAKSRALPPPAPSALGSVGLPPPASLVSGKRRELPFPVFGDDVDVGVFEAKLCVDARRSPNSKAEAASTPAQNTQTPVPVGHTSFSWGEGSKGRNPCGHTKFSWGASSYVAKPPPTSWKNLKLKGNKCFKRGDYYAALTQYSKALETLSRHQNGPDGIENCGKEKSMLHLNRAAAYLKLQRYPEAAVAARDGIKLDEANPKAWYRLAKVLEAQGTVVEALQTIEKGLNVLVGTVHQVNSEQDSAIRTLQKLSNTLRHKMVHKIHLSKSTKVSRVPAMSQSVQTKNLSRLNSTILGSNANDENVVPARDRPTKGQAIRPHLLAKSKGNFPAWYKDMCGKPPKLPEGLALENICRVEEKEKDQKCVEGLQAIYKMEQSKFAPCIKRLTSVANECIDPKDVAKITNPFAKHNRAVFQMAAQNLACEYMATDKLQVVQQELNGVDPLAANLILVAVLRAIS